MEPQWCVAQVIAGAETGSVRRIAEAGFGVFQPIARFQVGARSGKRWVKRALFPGYAFVRLVPDRLRLLLDQPGVIGVLGAHDEVDGTSSILPVPNETVDKFLALCPMDQDRLSLWLGKKPESGLRIGDRVVIAEGPFASFPGIVVDIDRRGNLGLDVHVFGRATRITIDRTSLQKGRTARPCNFAAQYVRAA